MSTPNKARFLFPNKTLFLIGPSGSGKTSIGKRIASKFGTSVLDTDKVITERENASSVTEIFSLHGEGYFRNLEKNLIMEILQTREFRIVSTGGGLPAIPGMMDLMNKKDITIYLRASIDSLWKRLNFARELEDRPLLKGSGKDGLHRLIQKREDFYLQAKIVMKTDRLTVDAAVQKLLGKILEGKGTG